MEASGGRVAAVCHNLSAVHSYSIDKITEHGSVTCVVASKEGKTGLFFVFPSCSSPIVALAQAWEALARSAEEGDCYVSVADVDFSVAHYSMRELSLGRA